MNIDGEHTSAPPPVEDETLSSEASAAQSEVVRMETARTESLSGDPFDEPVDFSDWQGLPEFDEPADEPAAKEPGSQGSDPTTEIEPIEMEDVIVLDVDEDDELSPSEAPGFRISWPAVVAAAVLHLWFITTLAGIVSDRPEGLFDLPIHSLMEKTDEPDEELQVVEYELAVPQENDLPVREVLNAASVGQSRTRRPKIESAPLPLSDVVLDRTRAQMYDIPEGVEVDERLVVKGQQGDSVVQMDTALDRVTWEIARNMQESKVLVVWMLDASGSLKTQREQIAARLDRIYGELGALEEVGQIPRLRKPLLSGVVSYGERTEFLTHEPTDKFEVVREAIEGVQPDPTGRENVFSAVVQTMQLWKGYRTSGGRRIMLVVVTDETGDDFPTHVPAISLCRRYGAQAYVIGPTAVFGRQKGYVPYVAPEDGQTYRLQVDLGPETAMFDLVDLPFWYNGPQYKYLSAGFGPYALSRLVRETGGIYFTTTMTTMQGLSPVGYFDGQAMKPFMPDYRFGTFQDYAADLARHPLRFAVVQAARLSRENEAEGTPALTLRVNPNNYRQAATDAQRTVAKSQLMIENILEAFPPNVDELYEQEPSARWRTAFNLAYGRLLANRVRCYEYNAALADLKGGLTPADVANRSNQWIFKPSDELNYATNFRSAAKQANEYLQRVIDEAPDTPWAVLAARELQNALGIRIIHRFIPPPQTRPSPPRANNNPPRPVLLLANDKKKSTPRQPPPKKKKVVLPKL